MKKTLIYHLYVGEDIESLLTRLLQAADYDVKQAEKEQEEAELKKAET